MINLDDIAEGVAEMTRAKKTGLDAAIITVHPAHEHQYFMHEYDPFWAAAQEMDVPPLPTFRVEPHHPRRHSHGPLHLGRPPTNRSTSSIPTATTGSGAR